MQLQILKSCSGDTSCSDLGLRVAACLAGVVTTASTVFARIFIGVVCDRFGPRYGEISP